MARKKLHRRVKGRGPFLLISLAVLGLGLIAAGLWYNASLLHAEEYVMVTERGMIRFEVYPRLMPRTAKNFQRLVEEGFYEGLTFHRVEAGVVQGGDPAGDGTGEVDWQLPLETNMRVLNERGAIGMARGVEADSAGSQFYILKDDAPWLDGDYAVFGRVIEGMEVVEEMEVGDEILEISPRP